jgi:NAD(P)-dependent dehydrogenase (short-subunit alcohol dehydrogenase family)
LERPKRKNPVLRTRLPTLPPAARSRVALGLTAAAALGRFELQQCRDCAMVQYPPREACQRCLSINLSWKAQKTGGELLAQTVLHHSNDLFFRERLPWRLGLVKLDCGPTVVAHLHQSVGQRVRVRAMLDRAGQAVIAALPDKENTDMADDPQLREFTCDPRQRKILVTDGKTALGHVTLVPLDLTDSKNVRELAAEIAGKVDIVVNNAEYHRSFGIGNRQGVETARAEMDVNYFGLLRLAQAFGPAMRSRGADGKASAVAWVNLLSIYALANFPPHGRERVSRPARRRMEPAAAAAQARPGGAGEDDRRRAARRHRGSISRRRGAGMAGPLAR